MLRKRANLVFSIIVVFVVAWMVWQARDWSFRARLFPWTIGWPALALAIFQLGLAVRAVRAPSGAAEERHTAVPEPRAEPVPRSVGPPTPTLRHEGAGGGSAGVVASAVEAAFGADSLQAREEEIPTDVARRRGLAMSAWILAFTFGVLLIGFKLGPAVVCLIFLRWAARESWPMSIGISFGLYLFFLLIFEVGLNIRLPTGWISDLTGYDPPDAYLVNFLTTLLHPGGS